MMDLSSKDEPVSSGDTVRIGCRVPNGVMLRLSREGYDDGTGFKPQVNDGPGVRLNGPAPLHAGVGATEGAGLPVGETEIDAEWWDRWAKQHEKDPLLLNKQVFVIEPQEKKPANPTR